MLAGSGCGYKKDPYYLEEVPNSNENVKFIIKKEVLNNDETVK